MAALKDLSNALTDEFLNDMATNFFGARKDIDDTLEYFESLSAQLLDQVEDIHKSCALLQYVCLGEGGYSEFCKCAGIDPSIFNIPSQTEPAEFTGKPSFSITNKGEYIKWVSLAYHQLAHSVEKYMHGIVTSSKADHGRKIRSLNRIDFYLFAEDINAKIVKVNTNSTPSEVLKFTKSLDPETSSKQNITGCVGPECAIIDNDLAFKTINIEELNFPEFPDLPADEKNPSFVCKFCSKIYANKTLEVKDLLKKLNVKS
ncbi:hypothetical protein [Maridesulfovibrio frigidus]|uniref:hypothetical protein n=1 Tax=Maridesulfovibrio frigidus TaxID=340956 RepID=UPI0004E20CD9|nr:hypothetical protein [Maridesulfovibrio frigidus]